MEANLAEFLGTALLILLGNGVVANVVLKGTKGHGSGWIVICAGWGFAVFIAVVCVGEISGAHINPAVTLGLAVAGRFAWAEVPGYVIAQMAGAILGGGLVFLFYQSHYTASDDADGKLANIMFANELARRCEGTNVTANSLHPGVVRSGFGQDHPGVFNTLIKLTKAFYSSPESGARTSIFLASDPSVEGVTGTYFVRCKARRPSCDARSEEACARLWALSADLTGADLP